MLRARAEWPGGQTQGAPLNKSKTARVAGFVAALGASATLVGFAANGTGAYFTDSAPGNLTGSTGHLRLNADSDTNLNFSNLVPGEYQSQQVKYHTDSSTNEDVWLYFPDGQAYGLFTGAKGGEVAGGGLGRYGHLEVDNSNGDALFSSYNLQDVQDGVSGCADANGHGSGPQATSVSDTPPYCGVPHYMLLESNVPSGSYGSVTLKFGVTGRWTSQNAAVANVPFQLVATQHGIRPDAGNF